MFWTVSIAAQETSKPRTDEDMARDAAVIETVLVDLLSYPDSPIEPKEKAKKEIHFSTEALSHGIKAADVLRVSDDKKLGKLTADQLVSAREAAEHLAQRAEKKDVFKDFAPKDNRIRMYSREQAEKDKQLNIFERPQVFRAYSPGYSRDQELAIVHLFFTWSSNFHGAAGTYVLAKRKDGWTVLLRDFMFFL